MNPDMRYMWCLYCGRLFRYDDMVGVIDPVNHDLCMACRECAEKKNKEKEVEKE